METEKKLWQSYRETEARERSFRKQLAIIQKQKNVIEIQNDILQKKLEEVFPFGN